ncbi:Crinkler (CRN) [Phytophthora megakarya]|uniref:Crinkler (CRN) n=1 Tax=Phytophthora megakarya TaxID=4795 RepID=A0A225UM72_9STRA|nr:Crinkler (CRN) [Phytophthora megakarya]
MIMLRCSIVGYPGNPLPVKIEPNLTVGHLMIAIKNLFGLLEFDASALGLFLATTKTKKSVNEKDEGPEKLLSQESVGSRELRKGSIHPDIQA